MQDYKLVRDQKFQILMSGLVAGFALYLATRKENDLDKDYVLSFILTLFYFGKSSILMAHFSNIKNSLLWALGIGVGVGLLALQYFIHVGYDADLTIYNDAMLHFFLSLHFSFFLIITFIQTYRDEGWSTPYPALFNNAWSNLILTILPFALVGAFYLALYLVSELFKIVGITLLHELLKEEWFNLPLMGLLYSAAIMYLREHGKTMQAALRFILAMFRIVGLLLCSAALLFLIKLHFSGVQVLWDSRLGAGILLTVVLITGFYANAYIGNGKGQEWAGVAKWRRWIVMAAILAMPIFLVLCAYAFYLRIEQYGLTADRVYSFPIIAIALAFALSYCWHIIKQREDWVLHVGNVNKYLAGVAVFIALAMQLAPFSAYKMAANSQYNRIMAQKDAGDTKDVDFAALKFGTARPGRILFDQLVADDSQLGKLAYAEMWTKTKEATSPFLLNYRKEKVSITEEDVTFLAEMGEVTVVEKVDIIKLMAEKSSSCF